MHTFNCTCEFSWSTVPFLHFVENEEIRSSLLFRNAQVKGKAKSNSHCYFPACIPTATSAVEIFKSRLQHQKTDSEQKETIYVLEKTASPFKKFRLRLRKKKYL